jgi:hypothetical protein
VGVCTGPHFGKRQKTPEIVMPISLIQSVNAGLREAAQHLPARLAGQKLFKTSKFCMISVALIPVMNYYA